MEGSISRSTENGKLKYFTIGGLSGFIMETILHPIGIIRTRQRANEKEFVKFLDQLKRIYVKEGAKSFFTAYTCTFFASTFGYGSYFYAYEKGKDFFLDLTKNEMYAPALAGAFAGLFSDMFYIPCCVVRSRMQIENKTYDYKHFLDGIQKIYKKEGAKALYRGGYLQIFLDMIDSGLLFGMYENLMTFFKKKLDSKEDEVHVYPAILSSTLASVICSMLTSPLDVVLLRVQVEKAEGKGRKSVLNHIQKIYKYEGLSGFMKGYVGRMIIYLTGGAALFPIYEYFKHRARDINY